MTQNTLQLLVMRHAEKTGDPADPNLSDEGVIRAQALATYLPDKFGPIDFLIAAAKSKHSSRPTQTLEPLSAAIGVPIDDSIADNDYGFLASELLNRHRYREKRVIVCWHHGNIPSLMHALGAEDGTYPNPWARSTFDLILVVDRADQHITVTPMHENLA